MARVIVPTSGLVLRWTASDYDAAKSNGDAFSNNEILDNSGNGNNSTTVSNVVFEKPSDNAQSCFNIGATSNLLSQIKTSNSIANGATDLLVFIVTKDNANAYGVSETFYASSLLKGHYNGLYKVGYQDAGIYVTYGDISNSDRATGQYNNLGQDFYNLYLARYSPAGIHFEWDSQGFTSSSVSLGAISGETNGFVVGGNLNFGGGYNAHLRVKDVLVYKKTSGQFTETEVANIRAALNAAYYLPTGTTPVVQPSNNPYILRNATRYFQPRGFAYTIADAGFAGAGKIFAINDIGVLARLGKSYTLNAPNVDAYGKIKVFRLDWNGYINNANFRPSDNKLTWNPPNGRVYTSAQRLNNAGDWCEFGTWSDIHTQGNFLTGMVSNATGREVGLLVSGGNVYVGESTNNYNFNTGNFSSPITWSASDFYKFELQADTRIKVYKNGAVVYTTIDTGYQDCWFDINNNSFDTPQAGATMRLPMYYGTGITNYEYAETTYQVVATIPDATPPTDVVLGNPAVTGAATASIPFTPGQDPESGITEHYFQVHTDSAFPSTGRIDFHHTGGSPLPAAGLAANTLYYIRAVAINGSNVGSLNWSNVKSFTTWNLAPQIVNVSPLASAERNGAAYNVTLVKTNGDGAVTFSCDSGLPNGLSIHPATGVISGTASVLGVYSPVFRVTDSRGQATTKTLQISVLDVTPPAAPVLGTVTTTADGYNIIPFYIGADEAGGSGTASLRIFRSVDGGATFPFVVGYDGASPFTDGTTGGFPTAALKGSYKAQTVDNANNVSGESNVVTNNTTPNAPIITSSNGEIGGNRILFTFSDNAGGGGVFKNYAQRSTAPDFSANVVGFDIGTTGNFLDDSAPVGATVYYRLFSRNRAGNNSPFTAAVSLIRPVAPVAAFSIPAAVLINTTFYPVNSSQNATGYAWYVMQGNGSYSLFSSLAEPPITLNGAGTYTFKLAATNTAGSVETTHNITVTLPPAPVITTNSPLSYGRIGYPYQYQLQKTGQNGTFSLIAPGNLPNGALSASGLISIANVGSDNYNFTVRYTDVYGQYDDAVLTIPVSDMAVWEFCYRRPLKIEYLESVRIFEPIEGAEEVIEDVPTKREFTLEVGAFGLDEQADLLSFLQEHRRRKKFLFSPELSGEQIVVRIVNAPSESRALAGSDFEVVLREV